MQTFEDKLINWYEEVKRDFPFRNTSDPYYIWISEIMSQQTQMSRVVDYYLRFIAIFPTISSLADADEEHLLKAWEGLGYYSRVRNMQTAAQMIMSDYEGVFPSTYEEILTLKGIGPYTAAAIASICFGEKVAAVDGNVLRVTTRFAALTDDISKQSTKMHIKKLLEEIMTDKDPRAFNQGMIELGATLCSPTNPSCVACPLKAECKANIDGLQDSFPVKTKKVKQKIEQWDTFVVINQNGEVFMLKQEQAFLQGLFLLPQVSDEDDVVGSFHEVMELVHPTQLPDEEGITFVGKYKHIFSHKIWQMNVYIVQVEITEDERFVQPADKPIANAHRNFMSELELL